jgi:hypothetical protein
MLIQDIKAISIKRQLWGDCLLVNLSARSSVMVVPPKTFFTIVVGTRLPLELERRLNRPGDNMAERTPKKLYLVYTHIYVVKGHCNNQETSISTICASRVVGKINWCTGSLKEYASNSNREVSQWGFPLFLSGDFAQEEPNPKAWCIGYLIKAENELKTNPQEFMSTTKRPLAWEFEVCGYVKLVIRLRRSVTEELKGLQPKE